MKVKEDGKGNITFGERKPEIDGITVLSEQEMIARHEMMHHFYTYPTFKKLHLPDSSGTVSKDTLSKFCDAMVKDPVTKEAIEKICRDFMINEDWKERLDNPEEDDKV
jgi:hypothetical protein